MSLSNDNRPRMDGWVQAQMVKKPPFSVEVPGYQKKEGETIPRRHPLAKDKLITLPSDDVKTVYDNLKRASAKFGNAKAVGTRKIIKTHVENKKVKKIVDGQEVEVDKQWTYYELSGYSYMSFIEYDKLAHDLGSGLRHLGITKEKKMHLYGATSAHWLAMSHAAASQSIPIVTAYDSLGEDGLRHSLVQTNSAAIFLDPNLIPVVIKVLKDATHVKSIIYNTDPEVKPGDLEKLKSTFPDMKVLSLDELRKSGAENPVEPVPPGAEDLACIMYTSGSTGPPKGVTIKHKAVVAAMAGVQTIVAPYISPADALLTYLPQSHIFEYMFENLCMFWGGTMGYGNPKTLSDASVRNCKGDIREFRPTILIGVPAVWESVKKGILAKINSGSFIVKNMFWGAMSLKQMLLGSKIPGAGLLDAIVFKKLKDATGGRLRIAFNGGGPISQDTIKFISYAITPMISGYGLTETTAMGAIQDPLAWDPHALGDIPGCIEIKLVDFPDAGYYSTNKPPQGEIWIRGPSVTEGYWQNEQETREAITDDGWFKTGDIGEFNANGHLRIIDRKKNLVKTLNGEYIALEKLESAYRTSPIVGNICVFAAEDKARPIAIIVPVEAQLKKIAAANGIKGDHLEEIVHDKKLNSIVLKEIQKAGREVGLAGIEIIDGVVLVDEEWTPQNGFISPAQKLQRKKIQGRYEKEIHKAYGN
ncbi:long-chain acyl-CoA synthetase [Capronia coronata CBS 617.96]|uniref:Long-chain acyl-CoA synthetase n=1 Tax=Capronia coronata CBS 617.96 TaxID=1182541 RepID=W9Y0D6_9EURO|nr:long-chain acyl-CoA synthetase [Capronia coronata CBS 617.96]EXJ83095.1 long-chain acyl-CoA synthetase [Capronia coronata CBS 617.96]